MTCKNQRPRVKRLNTQEVCRIYVWSLFFLITLSAFACQHTFGTDCDLFREATEARDFIKANLDDGK